MYTVRFSTRIQADVERGWSAWMNTRTENLADFIGICLNFSWDEKASQLQDEGKFEEALELFEEKLDIRMDGNEYCIVHHEGLSCFGLDSEKLEGAEEEAKNLIKNFSGSFEVGDMTIGEVKIIKKLQENWYLLEVEDYTAE